MSDRCKKGVQDHTGWRWHRCSRKSTKDGYCWQHHPDAIKERDEKAMQRFKEKIENSPLKQAIRRAEKAEARVAELEAKRDYLEQRFVRVSTLAHKWMVCHDKLKAGLPYEFPKPADLPELQARVAELEAERDWWEKRACQSNKRLHPGSYLRYLATTTD